MTGDPDVIDRRPRWRKKRWWAAGLLWLPVAYSLSLGPASYAVGRGWMSPAVRTASDAFYAPLVGAINRRLPLSEPLAEYANWWAMLGWLHADSPPQP